MCDVVLIAAHWLATRLPVGSRPLFLLVAQVVALPFGYRFERHTSNGVSEQVIAALGAATAHSVSASDTVATVAAISREAPWLKGDEVARIGQKAPGARQWPAAPPGSSADQEHGRDGQGHIRGDRTDRRGQRSCLGSVQPHPVLTARSDIAGIANRETNSGPGATQTTPPFARRGHRRRAVRDDDRALGLVSGAGNRWWCPAR
jgi:hypothetical protein